ncbi:MAG: glycosyltransferase family 39 protein [Pseudomonadota bacterium]
MITKTRPFPASYAALAVVLSIAVFFHLTAAVAGLPYINHPDEPTNLGILHRMMLDGTANPRFFNYPSLLFYLHAPGQLMAQLTSETPIYLQIQAMGSVYAPAPEAIILARMTSLLAHGVTICALFVFLLPRVGCTLATAAALLTAMSPLTASYSIWATPDVFVALFVTLCLMACIHIVETGRTRAFVFAGIAAGCAAATKYNAGIVAIAIVAAAVMAPIAWPERGRLLARAAVCSILAMSVAAPFLLLDFGAAVSGFLFELRHYGSGHWGAEGDAFSLNVRWVAVGLGAAILLMLPTYRRREMVPLLIFVVGYFALLASQTVRFERNLAPLVPAVSLLAAVASSDLITRFALSRDQARAMAFGLSVLMALPALWAMVQSPYPDRIYAVTGRDWVETVVPEDARVVVEAYTPYLERKDRQISAVKFAMHDDWAQFSASHLVLSARASERFYEDPNTRPAYETWIAALSSQACDVLTYEPEGQWRYKVFKFECP